MFSLIAAIGKNRELGKNGQLIFRIKEDMQFFRQTTLHHTILMGHKTWDSLPGKLKDRQNLVVARNPVPGADQTITDLPAFIAAHQHSPEEIFVIGGGMVYFELIPYATTLYLTEVDTTDPDADTFFPQFDKSLFTRQIIKKGSDHGLDYTFVKYHKI